MASIAEVSKPYPFDNLVLSDRQYVSVLKHAMLTENYIMSLPHAARVVEIGSGLHFKFARRLLEKRPDLKPIMIDPSLGLSPNRDDVRLVSSTSDWLAVETLVTYEINKKVPENKRNWFRQFQTHRLANAHRLGYSVAADAKNLPLADESVNLAVDVFGPGLYLPPQDFPRYLDSLARILKPGGLACINPVGYSGNYSRSEQKKKEFETILDRIVEDYSDIIVIKNWGLSMAGIKLVREFDRTGSLF